MTRDAERQRQRSDQVPEDEDGDEGGGDDEVGDHESPGRRARAMTAGMVANSSRTTTASAVSRVRSEPARPMATPM
jgi:hypothetical protein